MYIINKFLKEELDLHNDFKKLFERSIAEIKSFDIMSEFDWGEEEEILNHFELLYELEYKYNMLKSKPFRGVEKRRENILKIVEQKSEEIIESLSPTLEEVFEDWLDKHALLNPEQWAKKRIGDSDEVEAYGIKTVWENLLSEYVQYKYYPGSRQPLGYKYNQELIKMIEEATERLDEFPYFRRFLEDFVLPAERERIEYDVDEMTREEFNETYGTDYKEDLSDPDAWKDNAYDFANDRTLEDVYIGDLYYFEDVEKFVNSLDQYGYAEDIAIEFYKNFVFPYWYGWWSSQGIDETRERIENTYQKLKNIDSESLQEKFGTINMAVNSVHQNGSMMDYYEERFNVSKGDLEKLSNQDVEPWNKELRSIGLIIK